MGIAFSASDLAPSNQALKDAVQVLQTAGHDTVAQFLAGLKEEEVTIASDLTTLVAKLQDSVVLILERLDRLDGTTIKMSALALPPTTWTVTLGPKKETTDATDDVTDHIGIGDLSGFIRTGG